MKNSKCVLTKVRKYFPQVNRVVDSNKSVTVSVQSRDSVEGKKKDPAGCALARACQRLPGTDGAIINIGFSYLIKGKTATRYKTSVGVGREITSFDRHQDFAEGGDYVLSKVGPSARLGHHNLPGAKTGPHLTTKPDTAVVHKRRTSRIRVSGAE